MYITNPTKAFTDYPFTFMGDVSGEEAPIREVTIIGYDDDKYCQIVIEIDGAEIKTEVKSGYLYTEEGRCGDVPCVDVSKLNEHEYDGYQYGIIVKHDMAPWDIGKVIRFYPIESKEQSYVRCAHDEPFDALRKDCLTIINKQTYEFIKQRPEMPKWMDEELPSGVRAIMEANWELDEHDVLNLKVHGKTGNEVHAFIQKRQHYCDRGHFQFNVMGIGSLDGADTFPRYYMDINRAKAEAKSWLVWRLYEHRIESSTY